MTVQGFGPRMAGDRLMYHRAVRVDRAQSLLFVSGHEARDDQGAIAHKGDMASQIELTVRRLEETVTEAGMTMADVVQIRIFTTDVSACKAHYPAFLDRLAELHCTPASLMAEVSALSDPDMLIEIEAVAAR
ncbi:Rid family hydrolase [Streptomyces sp. NPDC016845]|uniref:Rid family hydrolase n=1 Tax=Streptomyces sp. NPDC016845 TaxID=3364972 RepID=UPI00378E49BB